MEIKQTKNYGLFKSHKDNRALYPSWIKTLQKRILKRNKLAQNPITVTEDMVIVSGHHRLEAAKELGLPIYYLIDTDAVAEDVVATNAVRPWTLLDYLDYYVKQGKDNYLVLKDFAASYKISLAIAKNILQGSKKDSFHGMEDFRQGDFKIVDLDRSHRIASLITEVRKQSPDRAWRDKTCVRALEILQDKIDPKILLSQLTKYQMVITKRNSVADYLKQFENIVQAGGEHGDIELV